MLEFKKIIKQKITQINRANLKFNYNLLNKKVGKSKIMSVVKGDAYGHGMKECINTLFKSGSRDFYVARLEDAKKIRIQFKQVKIYLLSGVITPNCCHEIVKYNIIPIINNFEQLEIINKFPKKIIYILHFDTGMNRLGFKIDQIDKVKEKVKTNNIFSLMTHLTSSDDKDLVNSKYQLNEIKKINQFFNKPLSIANSAGIFLSKSYHLDYVRPGKSLYGINPFYKKSFGLKPVMSIYAPILQVSNISKGQSIGYSRTYIAKKNQTIATIDFGYSDGYLRGGSSRGKVFIDDISCPIVGRISMDLITIDVTKINKEKLFIGRPVEILGSHQTYEEIAYETGTNEHEILISLGKNSKKVYI